MEVRIVNRKTAMAVAMLLVGLSASAALAQGLPSQDQLKAQRDAQFEADWFKANPWIADYDAARAKAKEEQKLILAYFLPSYFN